MNGADSNLERARAQRDQAVACALLSVVVALALVLSSFVPETQAEGAREAARENRAVLSQVQQVLRMNQAELSQDQATLESLRRRAHP